MTTAGRGDLGPKKKEKLLPIALDTKAVSTCQEQVSSIFLVEADEGKQGSADRQRSRNIAG